MEANAQEMQKRAKWHHAQDMQKRAKWHHLLSEATADEEKFVRGVEVHSCHVVRVRKRMQAFRPSHVPQPRRLVDRGLHLFQGVGSRFWDGREVDDEWAGE